MICSDQLEVEGEENELIVRWVQETRKSYPTLQFVDSIDNLEDFLQRTYSYEIGQKAIANCKLESTLSIPSYFLLPKGESIKEALKLHGILFIIKLCCSAGLLV